MRDARTGAVTDRVTPPAGESFSLVTSAGQGVFFLTGSGTRGDSMNRGLVVCVVAGECCGQREG